MRFSKETNFHNILTQTAPAFSAHCLHAVYEHLHVDLQSHACIGTSSKH